MRSITLKLTLSFLLVALIGTALIALFMSSQTRRQFDQFVNNQNKEEIINNLADYYVANGNLDGIQLTGRQLGGRRDPLGSDLAALTDPSGRIIRGERGIRVGTMLAPGQMQRTVPIEVDGVVVGRVLFRENANFRPPEQQQAPEELFLGQMRLALIGASTAATLIALLVGYLLARTIARPVKELTAATRIVALGDLGYQVPVHTQDELGELAHSFNRMSADLSRSNQARRQMTADVAHDLRTPLSVILGYTEALSDGKLQGSPEMYAVMYKEAQHLNHLIDDLRILSLADAGELPLTKRDVEPRLLLEQVVAAHMVQASENEIALLVEADEALPHMYIDPERMAQVLRNLVSNALRYTPTGGTIMLTAVAISPTTMQLQVQDSGSGISSDDLPHIFSRFYRGDTSRQHNGASGLGLAIAKSIVEAHGGTISVNSIVGSGTIFTINIG